MGSDEQQPRPPRPSTTLDFCAHAFEDAPGRDDIVKRLTAGFGSIVGT